jgi:hypothetical protein
MKLDGVRARAALEVALKLMNQSAVQRDQKHCGSLVDCIPERELCKNKKIIRPDFELKIHAKGA